MKQTHHPLLPIRPLLGVFVLVVGFMMANGVALAPALDAKRLEAMRVEAQRNKATEQLAQIRKEASASFGDLAIRHETMARKRLNAAVHGVTADAKKRIPGYASWIVSWQGNWEMFKAWKNGRFAAMLAEEGERQLLSRTTLAEALKREERLLNQQLGTEAETLSQHYENRVASVLAEVDAPVLAQLPIFDMKTMSGAHFSQKVVESKVSGAANMIGSMMLASFGAERFMQWLGPKIAMKGASKVVRVGTGPIGWAIGILGGIAIENAVDEKIIKPRLVAELESQLGLIEATLVAEDGPCAQIAHAQGQRAQSMSKLLAGPVTGTRK